MKSVYVKPEIKFRDSDVDSYIICVSSSQQQVETDWDNQLGKDRGSDIWSNDNSESSDNLW